MSLVSVKVNGDTLVFSSQNALDLTAPASSALLKNRKNAWVQLAGHPGKSAQLGRPELGI